MNEEAPLDPEGARTLRFLKTLVTVLTITMIGGVLTITALLVIRLQTPTAPALPAEIVLPNRTQAQGFSQGPGWLAVVTTDSRILIYSTDGTVLLQEIQISPPER